MEGGQKVGNVGPIFDTSHLRRIVASKRYIGTLHKLGEFRRGMYVRKLGVVRFPHL